MVASGAGIVNCLLSGSGDRQDQNESPRRLRCLRTRTVPAGSQAAEVPQRRFGTACCRMPESRKISGSGDRQYLVILRGASAAFEPVQFLRAARQQRPLSAASGRHVARCLKVGKSQARAIGKIRMNLRGASAAIEPAQFLRAASQQRSLSAASGRHVAGCPKVSLLILGHGDLKKDR
jgi:hypothetical protein